MYIKVITSAQRVRKCVRVYKVSHVGSYRTVCSLTRMECYIAKKGDKTSSRSVAKAAAEGYK